MGHDIKKYTSQVFRDLDPLLLVPIFGESLIVEGYKYRTVTRGDYGIEFLI